MKLRPSPVKTRATAAGLDVFQPEKAREPSVREWLKEKNPDFCTVVAYGKILPGDLLAVPRLGFVNVHFSILPAYRGAAPVQRAVMDGVAETGVSIMVLTEGMDEGPVLALERTPVGPDETAGEVGERLARMGGPLLVASLGGFSSGDLVPREQDHAAATYAPKIAPEEARIDWSLPARRIHDHVRGLQPAPGAWTTFREIRLKVLRTAPRGGVVPPATVAERDGELVAGTGDGSLALADVQPHGKMRMTGVEFARGVRLTDGDRLV
jgi:methionyl-tRNA formyltransferase